MEWSIVYYARSCIVKSQNIGVFNKTHYRSRCFGVEIVHDISVESIRPLRSGRTAPVNGLGFKYIEADRSQALNIQ